MMLIDRALEDDVDTIITCDNGIAAMNEIAYGKENGMTIVVTDHHEVPYLEENGRERISSATGGCGGRSAQSRL